jgi:hypothetical protein
VALSTQAASMVRSQVQARLHPSSRLPPLSSNSSTLPAHPPLREHSASLSIEHLQVLSFWAGWRSACREPLAVSRASSTASVHEVSLRIIYSYFGLVLSALLFAELRLWLRRLLRLALTHFPVERASCKGKISGLSMTSRRGRFVQLSWNWSGVVLSASTFTFVCISKS